MLPGRLKRGHQWHYQACQSQLVPHLCCDPCSAKSTAAANAARDINPALKVNALQNRVSPATEDVFHDKFWDSLDLVVNALDNVNARLYVDSRCVYFGKPLLESGTLGPKCNTQVVIPNMTENYGGSCHMCPGPTVYIILLNTICRGLAADLAWQWFLPLLKHLIVLYIPKVLCKQYMSIAWPLP